MSKNIDSKTETSWVLSVEQNEQNIHPQRTYHYSIQKPYPKNALTDVRI